MNLLIKKEFKMQNVRISEEFRQLYELYKKRFENQKAFKSMRHKKGADASGEPVFYVGVPGLGVAVAISLVMLSTVYLLYIPFKWYVWVPYIIAVFFIFKIAMKYDKARQIRYMVWSLFSMSMALIERAEDAEDLEHKKQSYEKAKNLLHKAHGWVDEPALAAQLAEFEKIMPK